MESASQAWAPESEGRRRGGSKFDSPLDRDGGGKGRAQKRPRVVKALKLSEAQASYFSRVSRKSLEVPALQAAITQGKLSLSQARRIEPVITRCNSGDWIEKAATLPQRELERIVAEANPRAHVVERIRPVALDRSEMKVAISTALETKLGRVRDVIATKRRRPVSLEEALEAMTETYLDREDPVRRAARARASSGNAKTIVTRRVPASETHTVNRRDQGRCAFRLPDGSPCGSARWTELHHLEPWGQGGKHSADNLLTLCAAHHRAWHSAHPTTKGATDTSSESGPGDGAGRGVLQARESHRWKVSPPIKESSFSDNPLVIRRGDMIRRDA